MAGNTTQTITTRFKTEGASKVVKNTEQIGRAQTRLGQASASSGRQFAAQASGLGGLVAAYAGAAATVFALTAAFDALGKAARAEEIVRGTRALALEVGLNGQRILDNVQKITQGQLSLVAAAEQVNIAFAAGFDQKQIEGLTEVSLKAARALGRNLSDAFTRITRGAAKLEPELLDELGIFVRIDPAVERYANKLNIAASQLTNFERRQAFVNAIIDEGNEKFEAIGTTAPTSQKSLEQLLATIQNLASSFGQFIAKTLQPIVDYFNNNFNSAILLFVGILTLVFGKATEIVGSFVSTSLRNLGNFADRIQDKAIIPLQKIQQTQASLLKDIGEGGLKGIRLKPQIGQDPAQAQRFAQALAVQRTEQELSASQLQKINRAYKEQAKFLEVTGKTGSATYANLNDAIGRNNKLLEEGGRRVKYLGGISNFASKAITGISIALSKVGAALNALFLVSTVLQLVGVDVIGFVQKLFKGVEASENFKTGLVGIVQASTFGTQSLAEFAKGLGMTEEEIGKLDQTIIKANKTINAEATQSLRDELARLGNKFQRSADDIARAKEIQAELDRASLSTEAKLLGLSIARQKADQALYQAKKEGDAEAINAALLQIELFDRIERSINRFGQDLNQLVGSISSATGIASNIVADLFAGDFVANVDRATGAVTVLGERLIDTNEDGIITFEEQSKAVKDFASAAFIAGATVEKAESAFERGATTSDKLSAQIGGIASQLKEIEKSGLGSAEEIEKLTDRLNNLTKIRDRLRTVELIGKGINKAFSGEIGAIDTALFKGLVNVSGELAKNTNEVAENQTRFLFETLRTTAVAAQNVKIYEKINETIAETGKFIAEDGRVLTEQIDINAILQEQASNNAKAAKALAGSIFEIFQNTQKIIKAEEIREVQLKNQLAALQQQKEIIELQNKLALDTATQKAAIESEERALDIAQKRADLSNDFRKGIEDQLTAQKTLNDLKNAELKTQRDIADIQFQALLTQNETARTIATQNLSASVDRQLEDPRTTQREQFDLRKSLIELERLQAQEIFKEQSELAERTYINELAAISARKTILGQELDNLETRKMSLFSIALTERDLLKQRQAIEIQKINNERDLLKQRLFIDAQTGLNALDDIDRREALFEAQNKANMAQVESFGVFLKSVQALNEGEFTNALRAYLEEVEGITIETDDFAKNLIADAESSLKKASGLLTSNAAVQGQIFDAERTNAVLKLKQIGDIYSIEDQALAKKLEDTKILQKIEYDALVQSQVARLREIEAQTKQVQQQLTNEDLLGQKAYEQLQAKLAGLEQEKLATENALDVRLKALNDEFDVFRKLDMQIAGIVQSNFTDFFMDMNTALIEGSLSFKTIADSFRDMVGSMLREIQAAVFRQTIVDPVVGSITKGITLFGNAAGGKVQHKAGGGSILRDRVATMLEPGEFVIRKEAAKKIGMSKLQDMNAGTSDDPVAAIMALLGSRFIKKAAGGKMLNAENAKILGFDKYDTSGYGRPLTPLERRIIDKRSQGIVSDIPFGPPQLIENRVKLPDGASYVSQKFDYPGTRRDLLTGTDYRSPEQNKQAAEDFRAQEARRSGLGPQQGPGTQSRFNQRSLDQYGLGSRGFNPLALLPGGSMLSQLVGGDFKGIGYKDAPRPSTQKEAMELEKALAGLEEVYGVRPTRMRGFKLGDIDPVTGGLFGRGGSAQVNIGDAIFGARGRNGTTSFTSSGAAASAIFGTEADPGFAFRRTPLSVAEYNAASPIARARFNPSAYQAFGGQRAISVNQALQLNTYGGYRNEGGGYTIPSGTFSGTIRDRSTIGGDRPDFGGSVQSSGATFGGSSFNASRDLGFGGVGFAAGGLVRLMAGGGSVNSRDRVPALLEPGEFVIRRPMAKAIGGPALNQMNATGVAPNIAVNVNNQGVPKDVAVSAPRMNGDKVILDIITRDMRNNGAIRKSLRGNR